MTEINWEAEEARNYIWAVSPPKGREHLGWVNGCSLSQLLLKAGALYGEDSLRHELLTFYFKCRPVGRDLLKQLVFDVSQTRQYNRERARAAADEPNVTMGAVLAEYAAHGVSPTFERKFAKGALEHLIDGQTYGATEEIKTAYAITSRHNRKWAAKWDGGSASAETLGELLFILRERGARLDGTAVTIDDDVVQLTNDSEAARSLSIVSAWGRASLVRAH